jgi:hypothetical protein
MSRLAAKLAESNGHGPADANRYAEAAEAAEVAKERARRNAKRALDREEAAAGLNLPPARECYTLASYRAEDRPPRRMRVDSLQGERHNVVTIAAYKSGKSTLISDLVRALADGGDFLQRFEVAPLAEGERVAVWNNEMDRQDFEDYLEKAGVVHGDRVAIWNLRGHSVPLLTEAGREAAVKWLRAVNAKYWVIDPWYRVCAWNVVDENSNADVATLLQAIDEIAAAAGVLEVNVVHHTGHGGTRGRGASTFPGWADTIWTLSRDEADDRYLSAEGRSGVGLLPGRVELSEDGRLTYTDAGPRQRKSVRRADAVVAAVKNAPDQRLNMTQLYEHAEVGGDKPDVRAAVKAACDEKRVCENKVGTTKWIEYVGGQA